MKRKEHNIIATCLFVLLNIGLVFAQQQVIPVGFPADCPLAQPILQEEVNNSPAHIESGSLMRKAAALLNQPDKENVLGAIVILEKAAEIDSTNAAVFYQLSSAYGAAPRFAGMLKKTGKENSMHYFLKAFSLSPDSEEGIRGMANRVIMFKNDYNCAEKLLQRILESNPENASVRFDYAILLAAQNRFDEAYQNRETALADADSLAKLSILNNSSRMRYMAHDYDWVIEHSNKMIAYYSPKPAKVHHFYKALALAEKGRFEEALAESKLVTPSLKGDAGGVAALARSYILAGDIENGKLALQELLDRYSRGEHVVKYQIAAVYEALGDFDNTFLWLNQVVDDGDDAIHSWLLWLNHDPRWKRIRNDMRFKELKMRAGL